MYGFSYSKFISSKSLFHFMRWIEGNASSHHLELHEVQYRNDGEDSKYLVSFTGGEAHLLPPTEPCGFSWST